MLWLVTTGGLAVSHRDHPRVQLHPTTTIPGWIVSHGNNPKAGCNPQRPSLGVCCIPQQHALQPAGIS